MPWCPKCKLEYINGITNCVDCGTELVDELPVLPELVSFMETEKEKLAQKFVQFLKYSKVDSATYEFDEEKQQWKVLVKETALKQVKKLYDAFYSVETEQQLADLKDNKLTDKPTDQETDSDIEFIDIDSEDETSSDELSGEEELSGEDTYEYHDDSLFDQEEIKEIYEGSKKKPTKPTTYVRKEEQYKDLQSSAVTFLLVSILGIAVLVLNVVGVLNIFYGLMPLIVMGSLFVAFLIIGFTTYSKAQKVKTEIGEENRVTDAINTWLLKNVTLELLESLTKSEANDEIRFFHKLEKMKEMINAEFGELDESYLDLLVEEFYNNNYEKN